MTRKMTRKMKIGRAVAMMSWLPMCCADGNHGFLFAFIGLAMLYIGAYLGKLFFWQKGGEE